MAHYLQHLAARAVGTSTLARPRLPSLFGDEPAAPIDAGAIAPFAEGFGPEGASALPDPAMMNAAARRGTASMPFVQNQAALGLEARLAPFDRGSRDLPTRFADDAPARASTIPPSDHPQTSTQSMRSTRSMAPAGPTGGSDSSTPADDTSSRSSGDAFPERGAAPRPAAPGLAPRRSADTVGDEIATRSAGASRPGAAAAPSPGGTPAPARRRAEPLWSETEPEPPPVIAPAPMSAHDLSGRDPRFQSPSQQRPDRPSPMAVVAGSRSALTGPMPLRAAPQRADARALVATPTVHVTIGRLEVRATAGPPTPGRSARPAAQAPTSLEHFLQRRGRGGSAP